MIRHGLRDALIGLLIISAFAAPGWAAGAETREQSALLSAKLSLSQAIALAEQQTGGKAFDAGVDADHGSPRVIVETNGPKGVQTTMIDANTGSVLGGHAGGEPD